jgi:hypothetical protein
MGIQSFLSDLLNGRDIFLGLWVKLVLNEVLVDSVLQTHVGMLGQ